MAHMGVTIRKTTSIMSDELKVPWVVQDLEIIEGVEFISLVKDDTGFSRFVSGSTRGIFNMTFMNQMKKLRTTALTGVRDGAFEDCAPTRWQNELLKQRCKDHGLPDFVEITIPECEHDGHRVPARRMKVKSSVDDAAALCVELTADNLACIRAGMLASMKEAKQEDSPGKVINTKAVRWRGERNAFLAARSCSSEGKLEYKTFKLTGDSDKEECMEHAYKWARRE
jgi:hypothetical protein